MTGITPDETVAPLSPTVHVPLLSPFAPRKQRHSCRAKGDYLGSTPTLRRLSRCPVCLRKSGIGRCFRGAKGDITGLRFVVILLHLVRHVLLKCCWKPRLKLLVQIVLAVESVESFGCRSGRSHVLVSHAGDTEFRISAQLQTACRTSEGVGVDSLPNNDLTVGVCDDLLTKGCSLHRCGTLACWAHHTMVTLCR